MRHFPLLRNRDTVIRRARPLLQEKSLSSHFSGSIESSKCGVFILCPSTSRNPGVVYCDCNRFPRFTILNSIVKLPMRTAAFRVMSLVALALLTGCTSTVRMMSKKQLQQFDGGPRPVYVTNPEMHREFEILKISGIYQLSSQPDGARLLTLHPIQQYARCGNPLLLTIFTFGVLPGVLPAARAFDYALETDGVVERLEHHLPLYERVSIWEWFVTRNEHKVFAEALAWSSPQRRDSQSAAPNRPSALVAPPRYSSALPAREPQPSAAGSLPLGR